MHDESPVHLLRPPYRDAGPQASVDALPSGLPPRGTIVLVRVNPTGTPERLDSTVIVIGRRMPTCAIVLQVDGLSPQLALRIALRSRPLSVRAILTESTIDPVALREQLSDPTAFPDDLVPGWA